LHSGEHRDDWHRLFVLFFQTVSKRVCSVRIVENAGEKKCATTVEVHYHTTARSHFKRNMTLGAATTAPCARWVVAVWIIHTILKEILICALGGVLLGWRAPVAYLGTHVAIVCAVQVMRCLHQRCCLVDESVTVYEPFAQAIQLPLRTV
jgi:hypothetical protein